MLTELANSGDDFVNAFHVFLTYPFVDEVVGRDPQVARNLHMGDYTNLSVQLDVDRVRRERGGPPTCRPVLDPTEIVDALTAVPRAAATSSSKACRKVLATPQALLELQGGVRQAEERGQGHLQAAQPGPGPAALGGSGPAAARRRRPGLTRRSPACRGRASVRPRRAGAQRTDDGPADATIYDPASCPLLVPGMVVSR